MRLALLVAGALTSTLFAVEARAEPEPQSTVLLVESSSRALTRRLREEIESLGLHVELRRQLDPGESLELGAREAAAIAAIRITGSGQGTVEMTIVDRATGKTVQRRLAIESATDPTAAELIATRTVELLRASLLELSARHPTRGELEPTPALQALAPGPGSGVTFDLMIGPALLLSPNFRPGTHALIGATLWATPSLGVTLSTVLPISRAHLRASEGDVDLLASLYRTGVVVAFPIAQSLFDARAQAGVSLARLALTGHAEAPFHGVDEAALAFAPWLGGALRARLSESFALLLSSDLGVALPRTVVRADGDDISSWGRPFVTSALALEASWP